MTQNITASVDAAVVEIDLSAIRQQMDVLEAENARLNEEVERLKASCLDFIELKSAQKHIADLRAQLAEARRQPVEMWNIVLVAALARVQAETRAKCAAMVREHKRRGCSGWGIHDWELLADRMERGE